MSHDHTHDHPHDHDHDHHADHDHDHDHGSGAHDHDHDHGSGAHDHDHDHDHAGCGHDHKHGLFEPHQHHGDLSELSDRRLLWAVVLNMGLTVVEVAAGIFSGSLALVADAVHNFNDSAALLIAFIARKVSRGGPDEHYTFGRRRAELIGALINLTSLILVGIFLIYEAGHRLLDPQPIQGQWVMVASGVALVVDLATAGFLWSMSRGNMNMRAAFIHNLTDAAASVAVLLGGLAIWLGGPVLVDPVLTVIIALYTLILSAKMLRRTAAILMDRTPPDVSLADVRALMEGVEGVAGVHHLHLRQLDESRNALEAHVVLRTDDVRVQPSLKRTLRARLLERFHITHATLELELPDEPCPCRAPDSRDPDCFALDDLDAPVASAA